MIQSPIDRIAHVIVNLGLYDKVLSSGLDKADVARIVQCIRSADEFASTLSEPPFPWTEQEVAERLGVH